MGEQRLALTGVALLLTGVALLVSQPAAAPLSIKWIAPPAPEMLLLRIAMLATPLPNMPAPPPAPVWMITRSIVFPPPSVTVFAAAMLVVRIGAPDPAWGLPIWPCGTP